MTRLYVSKLTSIASDNGLSPGRRQAIIWTNAGILLIGPLGTSFSETLSECHTFSFNKVRLKMSFGKWRPFCLGLNVLRGMWTVMMILCYERGFLSPQPFLTGGFPSQKASNVELWWCFVGRINNLVVSYLIRHGARAMWLKRLTTIFQNAHFCNILRIPNRMQLLPLLSWHHYHQVMIKYFDILLL